MNKIDIQGLRKAAVLAALYNLAIPKGLGFLKYDPTPITEEQAEEILENGDDLRWKRGPQSGLFEIEYVNGRLLKIDLYTNELDARMYNKKNGKGSAELVIDILKNTGKVFSEEAKSIHEKNLVYVAAEALDLTKTSTIIKEKDLNENLLGTTVHIGLKSNEDSLKEAIRKAIENIE